MSTRYTITNTQLIADQDKIRRMVFAGSPYGDQLMPNINPEPDAEVCIMRIAKRGDKFEEVVVAKTTGANIDGARAYAARGRYCAAIKTTEDGERVKIYKPARLYLRFKAKIAEKPETPALKPISNADFRKFWAASHPMPAAT